MSKGLRAPMTALMLVGAVVVSGCTGSSSSGSPSPTPTVTSSSPSPTPVPPPQALQRLAALGTKATFHATYAVRQSHPTSRATWQVWRTPTSLRVDVVTKHSTATLISTPRATYSCSRAPHHRACFRVARARQPIPVTLRLLAVRLFTTDLVALSGHPDRYGIAAATPGSITVATHGGSCFHLTVPKQSATAGIETGSYCFESHGVLTVIAYPNGNVVRLTALVVRAPKKSVFTPYSSPTPLPG